MAYENLIHKYSLNGYNIVLDVCSGAVHIFDDISYKLLDYITVLPLADECPDEIIKGMSEYPIDKVKSAYCEVFSLYKQGSLFSDDTYGAFADKMVMSPVKAMCLHIAHDCNLRCGYCFAAQGDFGGSRCLMPFEVGKKAIDFLIKNSYGRRNLELDFFGGEPLMNFEVVKQIVEYARGLEKQYNKNFRFTLTTNGLLLNDENIDYINKEMSNIVLSIDGRKEVNDRLRYRVNGSGCYDTIVDKYKTLVDRRGHDQYYVRGTFTKYNLDFAEDVLHLNELGFDQISVEPVVTDSTVDYALTESDIPQIYAEYERLAKIIIDKKKNKESINFFHFKIDLDQGPCAIKRLRGCGAGNEYVAVTPTGDIYPCHQFVGMDEWKMGSVMTDELNLDMKAKFASSNVYTKEKCRNCWARFYCSGGCNANNLQYAGDILEPFELACDLEKKRIECSIMIKAALA